MANRDTRRGDTRERILEAARKRFGQESFGATTMRAIAEDAGLGVGTLYSHFRDKVSIVEAISTENIGSVGRVGSSPLPTKRCPKRPPPRPIASHFRLRS
jgi:AcrR family transcriptional regulator